MIDKSRILERYCSRCKYCFENSCEISKVVKLQQACAYEPAVRSTNFKIPRSGLDQRSCDVYIAKINDPTLLIKDFNKEWILVSEALPEEMKQIVFVYCSSENQIYKAYIGLDKRWVNAATDNYLQDIVTSWKPVEEKLKEEEKVE